MDKHKTECNYNSFDAAKITSALCNGAEQRSKKSSQRYFLWQI